MLKNIKSGTPRLDKTETLNDSIKISCMNAKVIVHESIITQMKLTMNLLNYLVC